MESQAGIAASKCISIFPSREEYTLKLGAGWTGATEGMMQASPCWLWGCAHRHK